LDVRKRLGIKRQVVRAIGQIEQSRITG